MTQKRHAEIVGAGLAGLAMATALGRRGWSVRVHEKSSELRMFGAGIWMWENGLRALDVLGVYERAAKRAQSIDKFETVDQDGNVMMSRPFSETDRLLLPPRSDVYDALVNGALEVGVDICTNSRVQSADPQGEIVLANGQRLSSDLVVVADGVYSLVRESLFVTRKIDYLTEGYIRVLIPREDGDPSSVITEYWNGARRLLYNPCTDDENYIALACPVDDIEARNVPINRSTWLRSFPQHESIIERLPDHGRWDRAARVTCNSWSSGKAVVIGDAAHGQPPNLGQAANMTFTNVVSLSAAVSEASDIPGALQTWEKTERPLSDHVQRWTTMYGRIVGHWPESLSKQRTQFIQSITRNEWFQKQFNRAAHHVPFGY